LAYFLWIIFIGSTIAVLGLGNPQIIDFLGIILNIVPFIFAYFTSTINTLPPSFFIFIHFIIPLLWYYFLSCLLISIWDKIKAKKPVV